MLAYRSGVLSCRTNEMWIYSVNISYICFISEYQYVNFEFHYLGRPNGEKDFSWHVCIIFRIHLACSEISRWSGRDRRAGWSRVTKRTPNSERKDSSRLIAITLHIAVIHCHIQFCFQFRLLFQPVDEGSSARCFPLLLWFLPASFPRACRWLERTETDVFVLAVHVSGTTPFLDRSENPLSVVWSRSLGSFSTPRQIVIALPTWNSIQYV